MLIYLDLFYCLSCLYVIIDHNRHQSNSIHISIYSYPIPPTAACQRCLPPLFELINIANSTSPLSAFPSLHFPLPYHSRQVDVQIGFGRVVLCSWPCGVRTRASARPSPDKTSPGPGADAFGTHRRGRGNKGNERNKTTAKASNEGEDNQEEGSSDDDESDEEEDENDDEDEEDEEDEVSEGEVVSHVVVGSDGIDSSNNNNNKEGTSGKSHNHVDRKGVSTSSRKKRHHYHRHHNDNPDSSMPSTDDTSDLIHHTTPHDPSFSSGVVFTWAGLSLQLRLKRLVQSSVSSQTTPTVEAY